MQPVARPPLGVSNSQDSDFLWQNEEDEGVGKAGEKRATDLKRRVSVFQPRKGTRALSEQGDSRLDLV